MVSDKQRWNLYIPIIAQRVLCGVIFGAVIGTQGATSAVLVNLLTLYALWNFVNTREPYLFGYISLSSSENMEL